MDGHNGFCPGGEERPYGLRSYVLALSVDVGDDRDGAAHDGATRRGNEGATWDDYLVACSNPKRAKGEFQSNGTVGYGNRILAFRKSRELLFKLSPFHSCPVIYLS